jgi:hypothetical protein
MQVVHLNKDKKEDPVKELSRVLREKWNRRDKKKAEKKYSIPEPIKNRS